MDQVTVVFIIWIGILIFAIGCTIITLVVALTEPDLDKSIVEEMKDKKNSIFLLSLVLLLFLARDLRRAFKEYKEYKKEIAHY
jgi:protein-S-isoprenylcysteine O-methyltransferase Ste14